MSNSSRVSLCRVFPKDVVSVIDEFLDHHPGHHFYRCNNACICCGLCTKKSHAISQFLHTELQIQFSVLMRQIIYRYTHTEKKLTAHSDIRLALGMIYRHVTSTYYSYVDARKTGWMLCLSGVHDYVAVACSSRCLQHMKQETSLMRVKNTTGAWLPYAHVYSYRPVVVPFATSLPLQMAYTSIFVSEARSRHRLMLRHARHLARISCKTILKSYAMTLGLILYHQLIKAPSESTKTVQAILCLNVCSRSLSNLFYQHDTILSYVDRCYWET